MPEEPDLEEAYLGDGVYCSLTGPMIKLRTERDDRDDVIYLEPEVYAALKEFARKIGWEPEPE